MIRNAEFNWERPIIKMPPKLLVLNITFYLAMLVVLPMKVPSDLLSLSCDNDVL